MTKQLKCKIFFSEDNEIREAVGSGTEHDVNRYNSHFLKLFANVKSQRLVSQYINVSTVADLGGGGIGGKVPPVTLIFKVKLFFKLPKFLF